MIATKTGLFQLPEFVKEYEWLTSFNFDTISSMAKDCVIYDNQDKSKSHFQAKYQINFNGFVQGNRIVILSLLIDKNEILKPVFIYFRNPLLAIISAWLSCNL